MGNIALGLMQLAGGDGSSSVKMATGNPAAVETLVAEESSSGAATGDYLAPWLETDECTSCDECIKLNPNVFAYNENNKAYIKNPKAGPYEDLVKAAEKCTAQVIHPGLPAELSAKDIEKWIKRGEKYN